MPDQNKLDSLFIDIAHRVSQMSHDADTKVGAVIVKDGNILSMGYNGMPSGMDNDCKTTNGGTKAEVIHAEANAICKLAKSTGCSEGATLYCTLAPCVECAKLILQSGISRVVFSDAYKDEAGTLLLIQNIKVDRTKYASTTPIPKGEDKKS
jgi:dCMP deaminase